MTKYPLDSFGEKDYNVGEIEQLRRKDPKCARKFSVKPLTRSGPSIILPMLM
jgi:hypothetical protein